MAANDRMLRLITRDIGRYVSDRERVAKKLTAIGYTKEAMAARRQARMARRAIDAMRQTGRKPGAKSKRKPAPKRKPTPAPAPKRKPTREQSDVA